MKRQQLPFTIALGFTLTATGFLLLAPTYEGMSTTITRINGRSMEAYGEIPRPPTFRQTTTPHTSTLLQVNGPRVLMLLAVPLVLAILPFIYRKAMWLAAGSMMIFALITGFSVGLYYIPAAIALLVAALEAPPSSAV